MYDQNVKANAPQNSIEGVQDKPHSKISSLLLSQKSYIEILRDDFNLLSERIDGILSDATPKADKDVKSSPPSTVLGREIHEHNDILQSLCERFSDLLNRIQL